MYRNKVEQLVIHAVRNYIVGFAKLEALNTMI